MIYTGHIRNVLSLSLTHGGPYALACLLLLCPAAAHARQELPPPPAVAPAPQQRLKAPARLEPAARAPRAPAATPAQVPSGVTPPARPAAPRKAPLPVVVPPEVVTVVHRLSGWKLLAWLSVSGPSTLALDEWPAANDAHTNIVAGYVYEDGRSVVTRLPQAEVELEAFDAPQTPPSFFAQVGAQAKPEPEYTLVTRDGKHVEAKFVGLDSSTGLAMLEAAEPLLPGEPVGSMGDTDDPAVGQRVRLYAPIPAEAPPPPPAPAPRPENFIYLSIDQKEGRLTRILRAPSGNLSSVVVSANVSPEWVGAVAANELGEVVGIVSQSREGETRILPVTTVREACERVLKLRGSAPQPWLGARGDAAAQAPLMRWKNFGWPQEFARSFIEKGQGVLLDSVAPGTPAALAGLRPGDLIASVGRRDVRSNEDLSLTLKEAGVGSVVDLTVWRALAPEPLKLSVELKGVKNPALATAEAERRAASARLAAIAREVDGLEAELRGLSEPSTPPADRARAAALQARLDAARLRMRTGWASVEAAEERAAAARLFSLEGARTLTPQALGRGDVALRLKALGLHVLGLSPRSAAQLGAQGGVLVVAAQPDSPAAASGLLPGDVIETVNGSPLPSFDTRLLSAGPGARPAVFGLVRAGRRLSVDFPPRAADEPRR